MANYTEKGYDPSLHGFWKGTQDDAKNFGYPTNYYFADTMRSLFIGFGNFFNDLHVIRYDKFGQPVKVIDVPIKFGPRNKSHDFRTEQESGERYYISMPNLTYKIDSTEFDANRAKGIYETRTFYTDDLESAGIVCDQQDIFWSDVQPVPYNFNITMEANCEKFSDAQQIFEQIAPRFQPAAFFDIKEFWFFNKRRSIKLKLNSVSWDLQSDSMNEEDWRQIKVIFSFTLEALLYKPIKDAQIIEKINTYVTLNRGDYLYHGVTYGNKNGTLEEPYNFSKIYNTKVGNAYVLDGQPVTTYDAETSAYTTVYNYKQTEELVTYEENAKLLRKVITKWIPASAAIEIEGDKVYDPVKEKFVTSSHLYSNEWYTYREYEDLSGYGELTDYSVTFGNKVLYDQYNVPYSAYYSQYSEEGNYTPDYLTWKNSKNIDYQYTITAEHGLHPDTIFRGGKYFEEQKDDSKQN